MAEATTARPIVDILPTVAALADAAAGGIVAAATRAIDARGRFVIALSGGSTPRGTYELLAQKQFASRLDWSRVHVLWGDERCVPPDHVESNYRMAREALLDHVPLPAANVHRIHGEDDPVRAAASYEDTLRELFRTQTGAPSSSPGRNIDLALMGLGDNGHTASIFPASAAVEEHARWVMAEYVAAVSMWRITLTAPVLNATNEIVFIVAGGGKANVLAQVLQGPRRPRELPAQLIASTHGRTRWLVDAVAAAKLGSAS